MTERPLGVRALVERVLADEKLLADLNAELTPVTLSPDGSKAELSVAGITPHVVVATLRALDALGYLHFEDRRDESDRLE